MSPHTHVSVCTHPCLARCLDSGCSVRPPCPISHTHVSVCTHPCLARCLDRGCSVRPPCLLTHTCQSVLTLAWPGVWTADVVYARHVPSHTHVSVCTHPCLARCLDSGCSVRPPCLLTHTCQSVLTHAWPGVWTADVAYARHVSSHTRVSLYSPLPGPVSGQRM